MVPVVLQVMCGMNRSKIGHQVSCRITLARMTPQQRGQGEIPIFDDKDRRTFKVGRS